MVKLRHVYWRSIVRGWTTSRLFTYQCAWLNQWRLEGVHQILKMIIKKYLTSKQNVVMISCQRGGLAQLTERPGAGLRPVRLPGVAGDLSPRVHFQCRLPYGARIPHWTVARISICVRILAAVALFGHTRKNAAHTGMNGQSCSCGCCSLSDVRRPELPAKG